MDSILHVMEQVLSTVVSMVRTSCSTLSTAVKDCSFAGRKPHQTGSACEDTKTDEYTTNIENGTKKNHEVNTAPTTTTTTSVTNAQLKALIDQGVAAALAARDTKRSRNGDDSHNSGIGTEGDVGLTMVLKNGNLSFNISNCAVENQVKFATCTLYGVALTWWKSHVKTVGQDAAHSMPWNTLMKMMTDKYSEDFIAYCDASIKGYPDKVYKVVKALYGLHQAPRAWVTSTTKKDGIFISQDKYVDEILRKFNFTYVKSASTLVDLEKPLVKDGDATDVDENLYRSMIGSLMYLTASRLNIMFAVCACTRFQVTPKTSHLLYLKGKPTLGLWYSRDSPFELVAYTDSDYAGETQDRKSTTGGCQFLGNRMISWQCKKQNVVATSITEAEYVAAASCCRQVGDEVVHKELGDRMERAAITASSLEDSRTVSEGSEGFHQIIDFINASHIQYALIKNPKIYVSFIKQVWSTTIAKTSANGEVELTATFDGQVKTITEASLRRHLKLEDNGGITTLPNSEIFEQLALMGLVPPSTSQPPNTQPTPDAEEAILMPHKSPLHSVDSLGRDEGSLSLNELTDLCTSLSKKVEGLESELKQTKQTYSTALTKLILRVKKLEQILMANKSRRRARVVESDNEEDLEDPSKQGRKIIEIDQDPSISLGGYKMRHFKGMSYEDIRPIFEKKRDDSSKPAEGRRKKTLARKRESGKDSEESMKKQKLEDDTEKEDLKAYLDLVPRKEFAMEIKSLGTKYPIVDWKTHVLTEKFMYYQIFRADRSSKNYKIFSEMLDDFDRHDVLNLHRLVEERYATSRPEGYDLMLWGDLKILFQPDEEDKVWRH
ncbi:hypothetical protein Tco_0088085 [Tanacetum coccineum]